MRHESLTTRHTHSVAQEREIFGAVQRALAHFNRRRLSPGLGTPPTVAESNEAQRLLHIEQAFIESARDALAPGLYGVPAGADDFLAWFEGLRLSGAGQGDPLFPWLAASASLEQMRWFLLQEVAGEAGFEDLLAMTQVKMPVTAKLEMARNYWDEMGRGQRKGMHGPMLDELVSHLVLLPTPESTVPESLALGNMMIGLAMNRHYAFHSIGALGVIELTAPTRAAFVAEGLRRLGIPAKQSHYFSLHAVLDVKHSESWNREVLKTLVVEDSRRAHSIAEGALLRLSCGQGQPAWRCAGGTRYPSYNLSIRDLSIHAKRLGSFCADETITIFFRALVSATM
jgi:hypothetical protein